jgi:hypothetical protein
MQFKLEEGKKMDFERKKELSKKVKEDKDKASFTKKQNEMKFLGRIQHVYHKERKEKIDKQLEQEEKIKLLSEQEQQLLEKLKDTLH